MEEWFVLTYKDYNFTDDKSGRTYTGRTLHCFRRTDKPDWPGIEYAKMGVPSTSPAFGVVPQLNQMYRLTFDRNGKVFQMEPVQNA